ETSDCPGEYESGGPGWRRPGIGAESRGEPHFHVVASPRSGMAKTGRKNTYDRIKIVIKPDAAAENVWISSIGAVPQTVADHNAVAKPSAKSCGPNNRPI